MKRHELAAGIVAAAGMICSQPVAAAPAPSYGDTTVFVPFVNAAELADQARYVSPRIRVGFGQDNATAPSFTATMDTGSVGIIAGANYFVPPQDGRNDPSFIGPGKETLTSSGVIVSGDWYRAAVHLFSGSAVAATASVPVLAVNGVSCTAHARACHVSDPSGANTHYFGVGFGGGAGQPQGTPDKNAFLNITDVPGRAGLPSPGYILSTAGVQIGLTAANSRGFAFIKLDPMMAPQASAWQMRPANAALVSDWQHTRGTIMVNGVAGDGAILFDTGVSTAFLTPPPGVTPETGPGPGRAECNGSSPPSCAASGTSVSVFLPAASSSIAAFSYTVGDGNGPQDGNPLSPRAVTVDHNGAPFLNTTVRILQAFDYLYDAAGGFTGLRTTGRTPHPYARSTSP